MIISIQSLLGFLSDLQTQQSVDWKLLFTFATISILGLFFGIKMSSQISEGNLRKIFGYTVMVMGTFILFDQLSKM